MEADTAISHIPVALDQVIAIGAGTFDVYVRRRVPWHRPQDYEHMLDGLRKAGWRESACRSPRRLVGSALEVPHPASQACPVALG
jgi:hypothetical protein